MTSSQDLAARVRSLLLAESHGELQLFLHELFHEVWRDERLIGANFRVVTMRAVMANGDCLERPVAWLEYGDLAPRLNPATDLPLIQAIAEWVQRVAYLDLLRVSGAKMRGGYWVSRSATDQADNRQRLAAIAHHEGKLKMHTDKLAELVGLNAAEGMTASRNAAIRVAQQERQKILADLKALGVG